MMEPLVLEECGALLLRGNEDAEIMCSAPAVTSGVSQDVRLAVMGCNMRWYYCSFHLQQLKTC